MLKLAVEFNFNSTSVTHNIHGCAGGTRKFIANANYTFYKLMENTYIHILNQICLTQPNHPYQNFVFAVNVDAPIDAYCIGLNLRDCF